MAKQAEAKKAGTQAENTTAPQAENPQAELDRQLADLKAGQEKLAADREQLDRQKEDLPSPAAVSPRSGPSTFERRQLRESRREKKFMETMFPRGTVFETTRNRYYHGRFWTKGTLSAPLEEPGHPPGAGWDVHAMPDADADVDTMSRIQHGGGQKPEGA